MIPACFFASVPVALFETELAPYLWLVTTAGVLVGRRRLRGA